MGNNRQIVGKKRLVGNRYIVGITVEAMSNFGRLILRGIHQYANARREWLLHEELRPHMADFRSWPKCDGVIFAGVSPEVISSLANHTACIVSCSSVTDPRTMPVVTANNVSIGRMAAEHLLDRQVKHFAFYDRSDVPGRARYDGFNAAISSRGFKCSTWSRRVSPAKAASHRHWPQLLQWLNSLPKPVGIMARDDVSGSDLAAACLSGGLIVPDEVAIVAVNNDDIICEAAWPPLSSVAVDFARVGYLAARQLDILLRGGVIPPDERHLQVQPSSVVARLSSDVRNIDEPNLAMAIAFIRENGCRACAVSDILKAIPVSRSWLERQFREKFGRSPHEEILRVRMEHARRLLLDTNETVALIASRCGFSAVQNFNRSFQRLEGISPAKFRRAHRPH